MQEYKEMLMRDTPLELDEINEVFQDANDEAAGLIGNYHEVSGFFGAAANIVNKGLSTLNRVSKESESAEFRLGAGLAYSVAPVITGPITIPANILDRALWYTPVLSQALIIANKIQLASGKPAHPWMRRFAGSDRKFAATNLRVGAWFRRRSGVGGGCVNT